jgi:hypothetical protein
MFCWPCIKIYLYSETNVMHVLFNSLRIKGLYMFRALIAHPQEGLHKRHLVYVYCVRVMSVGCSRIGVPLQSWSSQLTQRWYMQTKETDGLKWQRLWALLAAVWTRLHEERMKWDWANYIFMWNVSMWFLYLCSAMHSRRAHNTIN